MILEIIQYTLPVLIVSLVFYFLVRSFLKTEEHRRKSEIAVEHDRLIIPLRLQAYERVILLLERIAPDAMLVRIDYANMSCRELQRELLQMIRIEFDHNVTQQLYLSLDAWNKVRLAKDQTVQIINMATEGTQSGMPAQALSHNIMQRIMEEHKTPSVVAIEYLKTEVRELF